MKLVILNCIGQIIKLPGRCQVTEVSGNYIISCQVIRRCNYHAISYAEYKSPLVVGNPEIPWQWASQEFPVSGHRKTPLVKQGLSSSDLHTYQTTNSPSDCQAIRNLIFYHVISPSFYQDARLPIATYKVASTLPNC